MRLLVQHKSHYGFPEPALFGPHLFRLRPAAHARARIESYSFEIEQPCVLRWQQDPYGNHVARVGFRAGERHESLDVAVQLVVDVSPVNPFDFFLDGDAGSVPFRYRADLERELSPFLQRAPLGPLTRAFSDELPQAGPTVDLVVALNRAVNQRVRYVIREEAGTYSPEETLCAGHASCRDSAVLLVALLRERGLAARFVSGYLIQVADEGMLPDLPRGMDRDVVDLHAWAEVYLPGAGWVGLDATSGLLTGEGHIPLACAAEHAAAAPLEGTTSVAASEVNFHMEVTRIGHEPRPTAPYTEEVWEALRAAARQGDARLRDLGVSLTSGGEPTFTARDVPELPEWNTEALGPTKWPYAVRLARELRARVAPGALPLRGSGKHYPGESLPRWALALVARRDGVPVWPDRELPVRADAATAERVARTLERRLGLEGRLLPAREDPWRFLQEEAALPVDVDPLQADLTSPEERRRLARVLDQGLASVVGWVLPLARVDGRWVSEPWRFRREHLFLLPGDAPLGLRLPLRGLPVARKLPPTAPHLPLAPPDPRSEEAEELRQRRMERLLAEHAERRGEVSQLPLRPEKLLAHELPAEWPWDVRTALTVEPREGDLFVFLPPLAAAEDFLELVRVVDAARAEVGVEVRVEGYPPPPSPLLDTFSLAPDPGVLEVNLPPRASADEYVELQAKVFEAALAAGLCTEKYLVDGRLAGSGGGHHLTLGGPSALESPFLRHPELLARLLTFHQHHPSLSYLFTGLFVGPSSQAPRVDEAREGQLEELEIALQRLHAARGEAPWFGDWLLRHLLVDLTGNTHRTEISIDKLFDWQTPAGRQGLLELRAFEMPPHPRMAVAQMLLARQLVAALASGRYEGRLARFGRTLHDRFLLPYWLWEDFRDVLRFLDERGLPLAPEAYRPFLELRCPEVGRVEADGVSLTVRNALEPWHVLGEQITAGGTARYVDSSLERVELRAEGLLPERHLVMVNGHALPMRATGTAGEYVAGVRFRAWAPPHALQPHLGIHHPLRFDLVDTWARRSLVACAYHVWHPEGRSFDRPPLTRFEAAARRAQRFTVEGPRLAPVRANPAFLSPDAPYSLDLRRLGIDRPLPEPEPWDV